MRLSDNPQKFFRWTINALLGVAFAAGMLAPGFSAGIDAAIIVLAAAASVAALNRQLPLQNVLPAALVAAFIGGAAHGLRFQSEPFNSLRPDCFQPFRRRKTF